MGWSRKSGRMAQGNRFQLMQNTMQNLLQEIYCLTLFKTVRKAPLFKKFLKMLHALNSQENTGTFLLERTTAAFYHALCIQNIESPCNENWQQAVYTLTINDENPFTLALENGKTVSHFALQSAQKDILILKHCADFLIDQDKSQKQQTHEDLFSFETVCTLWKTGAGLLRNHSTFVWENNTLRPIYEQDPITIDDLTGYEAQRSIVIENTKRFACASSANNMLLYGERGTGKSATVKAVARFFAPQGVRIIEVQKKELLHFSKMIHALRKRNFKFIIFIDDLTFEKADETYSALKTLLEGGLEIRAKNMLLYATSNRRHLITESAFDSSVRAEDSVQEQLSLSDRFGLTVIFSSPLQDEYLQIVRNLIIQKNLSVNMEKACADALKWEKWYNGRSPRTAVHFVEWLSGGEKAPWFE